MTAVLPAGAAAAQIHRRAAYRTQKISVNVHLIEQDVGDRIVSAGAFALTFWLPRHGADGDVLGTCFAPRSTVGIDLKEVVRRAPAFTVAR